MSDRKVLQVVLTEDQRDVIDLVLGITKKKVSRLVRDLLLRWSVETLDMPGVIRGGRCAKLAAPFPGMESKCDSAGAGRADWYLTTWRAFICEACAHGSNAAAKGVPIAVPATDQHQPAINLDTARAAAQERLSKATVQNERSAEELLEEMGRLAHEYVAACARSGKTSKTGGFDALVERFKVD